MLRSNEIAGRQGGLRDLQLIVDPGDAGYPPHGTLKVPLAHGAPEE